MSTATLTQDSEPQPLSVSALGRVSPWIHLLMAAIYLAFLAIVIQRIFKDQVSQVDQISIFIACALVIYMAGYQMTAIWISHKIYLAMKNLLLESNSISTYPAEKFGDSSNLSDSTLPFLILMGMTPLIAIPPLWRFLASGHDPEHALFVSCFLMLFCQAMLSFQGRELQLLDSGLFWKQRSVSEFIPWESIQSWSLRFTPIRSILTVIVTAKHGKTEKKQIAIPYLEEEEALALRERLRKYCGQPVESE